jgi:hypothetical protein
MLGTIITALALISLATFSLQVVAYVRSRK